MDQSTATETAQFCILEHNSLRAVIGFGAMLNGLELKLLNGRF